MSETAGYMFHHYSWNQLIDLMHKAVDNKAARLQKNIGFYKAEYAKANPDKKLLERLYKRLTEEQYEYDLFNEMLCRLETQNVLLLFAAWDNCIENEKKLTGKEPDDFSMHIYKVGYTYKLCYLPTRNKPYV